MSTQLHLTDGMLWSNVLNPIYTIQSIVIGLRCIDDCVVRFLCSLRRTTCAALITGNIPVTSLLSLVRDVTSHTTC